MSIFCTCTAGKRIQNYVVFMLVLKAKTKKVVNFRSSFCLILDSFKFLWVVNPSMYSLIMPQGELSLRFLSLCDFLYTGGKVRLKQTINLDSQVF